MDSGRSGWCSLIGHRMSSPVQIAIIGASGFGAQHLQSIETLEKEGLVQLTAVAALPGAMKDETLISLKSRGVRWYPDDQSLLDGEQELDAVTIATPIHLHGEMARKALARNLKIYLEKPPVPLIQDLDNLIAADAQKLVQVGFQRVLIPEFQQLKKWIVQGELGVIQDIRFVSAWPRATHYYNRTSWAGKIIAGKSPVLDGPVTNALSHFLHLITWLAGPTQDGYTEPVQVEAELYRARPIESYDTACLCGTFPCGIRFHFAVTHASESPLDFQMEIIGSQGRAWLSDEGRTLGNNCHIPIPTFSKESPLITSFREFVRFTKGERPEPYCSLQDTRGYTLTTNASFLSTQKIHDIPPSHWKITGQDGKSIYNIRDISSILMKSHEKGCLFSDLNVDWAVPPHPVSLKSLTSFDPFDWVQNGTR